MPLNGFCVRTILALALLSICSVAAVAQALSAGTITGVVVDPNNAAVPNANVTLVNAITGYTRTVTADSDGSFRFDNVPLNNYQLNVAAKGFSVASQTVNVRSSVPLSQRISLSVGGTSETVTVSGSNASDLIENVPSDHTDVDQSLIKRLPLRQPGSGLSEVVTLAAPGVVADSNGFFHPLGDHAEANTVIDGQSISDQQSKAFSTQ